MTIYLQGPRHAGEQRNNRFNLRRYFTIFSITVICALTVVLSALVYWNQRNTLIEYSVGLSEDFAYHLKDRIYKQLVGDGLFRGNLLQSQNDESFRQELDVLALPILRDYTDVQKIKIFNTEGKIVYSTDPKDIGVVSDSETMKKAFRGQVVSKLTTRETEFHEDSSNRGKIYAIDVLEVYVPIYNSLDNNPASEVIGAFEVYRDISSIFALMRREFYKVPLLLISSMGALFFLLQIVVRNAHTIISRQNDEIDLHNAELEEAQKRIKRAIDEVIDNESFHVRLQCDSLMKCWEVKNCTQTGCPSYKSENLRCWQVAGTFCGGKVQGYFAQKYGDCRECEVYQNAFKDRINMIGESFNNMMALLEVKHQELERLNERLNVLIDTDPLTEVGNRRSFQKRMESIHLLSLRYNHPYSIIICDVDNFKTFNDTYGHQKGDYALVSIANTMKNTLRRTDEIFRWGGEEFIIILPEQNLLAALKVAENIRIAVESLGIQHSAAKSRIITTSLGVACNIADNVKYISWENVIKQADDELYRAKAAGKNCVYPAIDIKNFPK